MWRPRWPRQEVRVATRSLVKAKIFRVATGFHGVVSRQGILFPDSVAKTKGPYVTTQHFVSCRWPGHEFFCRDRMFLCHDKVGNVGEALCRDRVLPRLRDFVLRHEN